MARQVLTRADTEPAPYDVELGALDTLTPDAIFAHYNGAAAGGSFLPCVTYYTQDGKVFARAFPPSSVAAGGSADVSFFPGLSQAPSGAGITTVRNTDGTIVVTNGTGPTVTLAAKRYTDLLDAFDAPSQSIPSGGLVSTELQWQVSGGNQGWFLPDVSTFLLTARVAGLFAVRVRAVYLGTASATKQWLVGGQAQNAYSRGGPQITAPLIGPLTGGTPQLGITDLCWFDAGDQYFVYVAHNQTGAQNVQADCDILRIW